MPEKPQDVLARMEAMLRRCRRRITMAEVSVRLREALGLCVTCLLAIAGLFLLFRTLTCALGAPAAIDWVHVLCIAGGGAVLILGRALWRGIGCHRVHAAGAAERLDLEQSTHNRIATAIALLRRGDHSPFAEAAIHDGLEHLEKLQAEEPYLEPATTPWRRMGAWLAVSLAMVLAGQMLEGEPRPLGVDSLTAPAPTLLAKAEPEPEPATPDIKVDPEERAARRVERQPTGGAAPNEDEASDTDTGKRPEPGKQSASEGPAGQHASGASRSSQSSSDSQSAASGSGAKSEPGVTEPGKNRKPRQTTKPAAGQPKVSQKNEKGGSINARGSSGSSSMRTAQNEWSSEVKARSSESDDFEREEEPDEEMDPDKQRLGMQPALKNRTSRISRELSLAMGTGLSNDMMKGRGGPNAQKKARGTATMIMGVPVPGFVRGRLLPGPTKSTQEEVEPTPREEEYAVPSDLRPARPEEAPQERYRPTADLGAQARDYVIKVHAENGNRRNGAATHE